MPDNLFTALLAGLAKVAENPSVFLKQADEIKAKITHTSTYEVIKAELDKLEVISYRVPEIAFEVTTSLFESVKKTPIKHQPPELTEYRDDIRLSTFPIFTILAYHIPQKVIPFLWNCLSSPHSKIQREARETLVDVAKFRRDVHRHAGVKVQTELMNWLTNIGNDKLVIHRQTVIQICSAVLNLEMQTSEYTASLQISLERSGLMVSDGLISVRHAAINLLERLYFAASDIHVSVLSTLSNLSRHPFRGSDVPEKILAMLNNEISELLSFYERIIEQNDPLILQKVGHDLYWLNYHHASEYSEEVVAKIFEIRDRLFANKEQEIFNVLIGFDAEFLFEWESPRSDFSEKQKYIDAKIAEYIEIMPKDFELWKKRIFSYSALRSNDLATFINYTKFLRLMVISHPDFAKSLVNDYPEELHGFKSTLLAEILKVDEQWGYNLINKWLEQNLYSEFIAHTLANQPLNDLGIYRQLTKKGIKSSDLDLLTMLVGSLAERFVSNKDSLTLLIKAIQKLTIGSDARWVNLVWLRSNMEELSKSLDQEQIKVLLDNLVHAPVLNYNCETILAPLVSKHPAILPTFLKLRVSHKTKNVPDYEVCPFRFNTIMNEAISKHSRTILEIMIDWLKTTQYPESYTVRHIIHSIAGGSFEIIGDILLREPFDFDLFEVMATEYAGNLTTEDYWKLIIQKFPGDEEKKHACFGHFYCAGSTSGFDGRAKAFLERADMFKKWQSSENPAVKKVGGEGYKLFTEYAQTEFARVKLEEQIRELEFQSKKGS